jgi:O-methyltransferase
MLDVRNFPLVSDQIEYPELMVIIRELNRVIQNKVEGAVVELGCFSGTTSLFIQRALQAENINRPFHVYDSFQGLPEKVQEDNSPAGTQFKAGELLTTKQEFIKNFRKANLQLPKIHKAWFEELTRNDMPPSIAFAFLDGDFYTSISASLAVITPLLSPGACIVIDDYQSEALPGARKAVDEWAQKYNHHVRSEQSLAIIHP